MNSTRSLSTFKIGEQIPEFQWVNVMKDFSITKLYYPIGEVSKITSLKPHVLRYWESEFPQLKPSKNRSGKRIYRRDDVRFLFLLKKLLYEEKFTIEGAKQQLIEGAKQQLMSKSEKSAIEPKDALINSLRKDLQEVLQLLS